MKSFPKICAKLLLGRPAIQPKTCGTCINFTRNIRTTQFSSNLLEKLAGEEYFIDLLFYHRKLKCLIAIELKAGKFQPEYAGKMNFYLNILDDFVREEGENPSIGIILCADKNHIAVEYALRGIDKPVGVAKYQLTPNLPKELAGKLPNAEELKEEILAELKK